MRFSAPSGRNTLVILNAERDLEWEDFERLHRKVEELCPKLTRKERGAAGFMLYDFIGCSVGDEHSEVIDFAEADTTVGPPARFIVSISIQPGVEQQQ